MSNYGENGLHAYEVHKAAESFLFIDNFCEELRMLYIGVDINISGITYFIQARLALHTLDTRAAEAFVIN